MKITLIGMGSGTPASLTAAGRDALLDAELILGARRLLEQLPAECTPNRAALYKAQEICARLRCADIAAAAVVFSGDTGFYSGASALCHALDAAGLPYTVEPGISSVQLLAAALHRPWQDWQLVSAHGCSCDPAAVCRNGKPAFFLTGGSETPATLCRALADAGVRVNMTLVFSPTQALMAANAGARYISPFVGRFDDIAEDGISQLDNVVTCIKNYDWTGKNVDDTVEIITASVRTPNHVTQAALLGADIATVPMAALKKCLHHPLTDQGLASFEADWKKVVEAQ